MRNPLIPVSRQTAAANFRFGVRCVAVGYLETSVDLLSWTIARNVIEAHGRDAGASSIYYYLRGVASAIIGEGC